MFRCNEDYFIRLLFKHAFCQQAWGSRHSGMVMCCWSGDVLEIQKLNDINH